MEIGLLDLDAWADLDELIRLANAGSPNLGRTTIDVIIAASDKKRFASSVDGRRIPANHATPSRLHRACLLAYRWIPFITELRAGSLNPSSQADCIPEIGNGKALVAALAGLASLIFRMG